MNIFEELRRDLEVIGSKICQDKDIWSKVSIETPKDPLNGDMSTNVAMIIASKQGGNPREISLQFKELLLEIPYIAHIEVAGPGFINFTIKAEKWQQCMRSILSDDASFWNVDIGNSEKVNVEYVSANPTGPMHIGHARGAVVGDVLANMLAKCGYDVTKEYYVNDAGSQVDTLLESSFLRYKEALTGEEVNIPEGLYPGDYLKKVGQELVSQFSDSLIDLDKEQLFKKIKEIVVNMMLDLIKGDLSKLGVQHQVFTSEQNLHDSKKIDTVIKKLEDKDLVYTGSLPPPKGKKDENWEEKEQLLFRSSKYGDDIDRPLKKSDGLWTYLAADIAYAQDKIDRGFENLIFILGADHSGYVKRMQAVIHALSDGKVKSDFKISQLVNFVKDGQPIKMSKRSGNFMTVSDVADEVDKDIIRFIMLTRRSDMSLDFDFSKVKQQSKDNPVFYVQYAHVRTKSILANAVESIPEAYDKFKSGDFDLSFLSSEEEIQLIKLLSSWPRTLSLSARNFEPHKIAYYLIDVASRFHSIWNLGKENNDYRFNIEDNIELTAARLALVETVRKIITGGFEVIGVMPINKM